MSTILDYVKKYFYLPEPHRSSLVRRRIFHQFPFLSGSYDYYLSRKYNLKNIFEIFHKKTKKSPHTGHYITAIPAYGAGLGHVLAEWNTGLIWAVKLNLQYAYCCLPNYWDNYMNLGNNTISCLSLMDSDVLTVRLPKSDFSGEPSKDPKIMNIIKAYEHISPVLFILYDGQNSFVQYETVEILRRKYFGASKRSSVYDHDLNKKINIAVHIRRADEFDKKNSSHLLDPDNPDAKRRFLPYDYFLQVCKILEEIIDKNLISFNIFSVVGQDELSEFFELTNVRFFLNCDARETFNSIVMSDVLVLSPSGFSFNAGMISKGAKIFPYPWWHDVPDNHEWCRLDIQRESINKIKVIEFITNFLNNREERNQDG